MHEISKYKETNEWRITFAKSEDVLNGSIP